MSGTIGTIALTLSPAAPDVHLTGTLDAYGTAGVYGGSTFYAAVFGPVDGSFLVHNSGVVESSGTTATDAGILLGSAGTVLNGGDILAGSGVDIFGGPGGEVHNKGKIRGTLGTGVYLQGAGTVENTGEVKGLQDGILLAGGGYALNTGTVSGAAGILLGGGPGGYVYNTGLVKSTKRDGISLSAAGYVYNTGHIRSAHDGIVLAGGGMAYNSGNIVATREGIFSASGSVYNYAKGNITGAPFGVYLTGAAYVYNAGSILGEGDKAATVGAAVGLGAGGYVYNAAGGRLTGLSGVVAHGGALTLVNEGFIYGNGSNYATNAAGIYAAAGGTVVNDGTIAGDENYYPGVGGILIAGGAGMVTNTGVMSGYFDGAAIVLRAGGTVVNTGKIQDFGGGELGILLQKGGSVGNSGYVTGVYAGGGASVTNTGTILGAMTLAGGGVLDNYGAIGAYGVTVLGGGTVLNAGKIESAGTASDALYFQTGFANELILKPGAVVLGSVAGGGGVLDLAGGNSAGTIDLNARVAGFSTLEVDRGAAWALDANSSLAVTTAVDVDGTLLALGSAGLTIAGPLFGHGTVDSGMGALTVDGRVGAMLNVELGGPSETLYVGAASAFSGTIESFASGDAIDLTGVASSLVTGISFSGGVLTVSEASTSYTFTFASPSTFAHERFSFFRDHGDAGITLTSRSQMTFLAPAETAAARAVQVPAVSYAPVAPAAVPSSTGHAGWLDSVLTQTLGALAPVVTIQS